MNGMSYQDLNAVYENREKLFLQREQEQKQMKESLNHLFEVVKQEKSALEVTAREQAEKEEEQKKKEQEMQAWYKDLLELKNQTVQEKKLVEEEKTAFLAEKEQAEMRVRVQTEQVKNESILAKQKQEEFEHKLEMLGLLLGKEGKDAGRFFEALMQAVPADTEEDLDLLEKEIARLKEEKQALLEENKTLQEENTVLKAKNETLEKSAEKYEEEKKGLLGLIAEFTKQAENVPKSGTEEQQKENVPKFGTEKQVKKKIVESVIGEQNHQSAVESVTRKRMKQDLPEPDVVESIDGYVPKFGTKASADEEVFEELTASVLEKYLKKNEPHCTTSQIRHSKQGEQLHVVINQLDHAFLFYQPAMFEISKPKKKSRELDRLLTRLNNAHPEIKFYYDTEDERVYATGYFSNTMSPDELMQLVHTVSDCFRK